jgi:heterodisulfide reductase subunit C2
MSLGQAAFGGFADQVESAANARLASCLQCGKCTSGCPIAARADIKPHEIVRLVQLGRRDEVLASLVIWQCTSCHTCATRCPQKVDICAMNDGLRRMSRSANTVHEKTAVHTFDQIFLRAVRKRGRMYELGLMASFKLRTLRFFQDVGKFPMMLYKNKLRLLPPTAHGRRELDEIFKRVDQVGGEKR